MTGRADLAASVAARLLNRARETGDDYQTLLTSYCLERFLYRLGASECRERFVLKGAMLLRLWSDQPYRATRDLDLLRRGDSGLQATRDDLRAIIAMPVPPDAVSFDGDRLVLEAIRAEEEYAGTRAKLPVRCGKARLTLQVDMGLGDAVWPAPQACTYPTLLDFPAPVPAEDPIGLTPVYWENPSRPAQVQAFARRARLEVPARPEEEFTRLLHSFLAPVLNDLRSETKRAGAWHPGGPWSGERPAEKPIP